MSMQSPAACVVLPDWCVPFMEPVDFPTPCRPKSHRSRHQYQTLADVSWVLRAGAVTSYVCVVTRVGGDFHRAYGCSLLPADQSHATGGAIISTRYELVSCGSSASYSQCTLSRAAILYDRTYH